MYTLICPCCGEVDGIVVPHRFEFMFKKCESCGKTYKIICNEDSSIDTVTIPDDFDKAKQNSGDIL